MALPGVYPLLQSLQTSLWDIMKTKTALKFCSINAMLMTPFVCSLNNEEDALMFFDYNNARHSSIRFTMEWEIDKKF